MSMEINDPSVLMQGQQRRVEALSVAANVLMGTRGEMRVQSDRMFGRAPMDVKYKIEVGDLAYLAEWILDGNMDDALHARSLQERDRAMDEEDDEEQPDPIPFD